MHNASKAKSLIPPAPAIVCCSFCIGFMFVLIQYSDALGERRESLLLSVLAVSSFGTLWAATSEDRASWLLPSLVGIGTSLRFLDFTGTFDSLTLEPGISALAMFYYWGATGSKSHTAWSSLFTATRYVPIILLLGLSVGQQITYISSNPILLVFTCSLAASLLVLLVRTFQALWNARNEPRS